MPKYFNHLKDDRVDCYSVLTTMNVEEYLTFINDVYKEKGGIQGQRSALKTKSAQRIRKRLVDDLIKGTVIPPIVLGVKLNNEQYGLFESDISDLNTILQSIDKSTQISIIDGMQRTTALFEASKDLFFNKGKNIRLEFWVTNKTNSLIYRMLVLNSGQIPWGVRRQIEVVFSQFRKELEDSISNLRLITIDENQSRRNPGEYNADKFIELFMVFSLKRYNIDIQEQLAEEFARLDIVDSTGNKDFTEIFNGASQLLVDLDICFSRFIKNEQTKDLLKYSEGKDIFKSQPARVGFMAAIAEKIGGITGMNISEEKQMENFQTIKAGINTFIEKLNQIDANNNEVLDLILLDEKLNIRTTKVGDYERKFFFHAYSTLIDQTKNGVLENMTPCWYSYLG